jgi:predicted nucleic acid-binding protein
MTSAVIDANIALYAVLPTPLHEAATGLIEHLVQNEIPLYVPCLWLSEVATGIRKTAVVAHLESEMLALEVALNLPVEVVSEDASLCRQAYLLAQRLGQTAVYDALYLALAGRQQAQFWTADRRLFNRSKEEGMDFVHLLE